MTTYQDVDVSVNLSISRVGSHHREMNPVSIKCVIIKLNYDIEVWFQDARKVRRGILLLSAWS